MRYIVIMSAKTISVWLDLDLLERVDADPEARERGRSSFVRSALRFYLDAKRRHGLNTALEAAYAGQADRMLAEIEPLLDAQAWPAD